MLRAERGGVDAQKGANCDKLNAARTHSCAKLNQNVNFAWQAGMLASLPFIERCWQTSAAPDRVV